LNTRTKPRTAIHKLSPYLLVENIFRNTCQSEKSCMFTGFR
jgi:hypothetical protein